MGFSEVAIVADNVTILKPGPKFVLTMLADRAQSKPALGGKAEAWPSIDELVRRTCQSRRTVFRQLSELESLGIIEIFKRWGATESGQARQMTNLYVINLPAILAGDFQASEYSDVKHKGAKMTPLPETAKNRRSANECQNDTLTGLECQNSGDKGATSDTPRKIKKYIPSPLTPQVESDDVSGPAAPVGAEPVGSSGMGDFSSIEFLEQGSATALAPESPSVKVMHPPGNRVKPKDVITPAESADSELVYGVLPASMQAIPVRFHAKIALMIRERLDAGWSKSQITGLLASRVLPDHVRSLPALVMARLRDDVPIEAVPDGVFVAASPRSWAGWSHKISSGRVVTRADLDLARVAIDFRKAQQTGDTSVIDRVSFVEANGVENYLL